MALPVPPGITRRKPVQCVLSTLHVPGLTEINFTPGVRKEAANGHHAVGHGGEP